MTPAPTAVSMVRAGLAVMLDAVGVVLLVMLAWQVMFGGSQPFESHALKVGLIGMVAWSLAPGAVRHVPLALLMYLGVALLSAATQQWGTVKSASAFDWPALVAPASHVVIMAVFIVGAAHVLRTPLRLSMSAILLVASIGILAVQILFDRASSNFVYIRAGSTSLPSVAQWGGLHQTGVLLILAWPFPVALLLTGQSVWRRTAGFLLAWALFLVALINGSTGGIATMLLTALAMGAVIVVRWTRGRGRRVILGAGALAIAISVVLAVSSGFVPLVAAGDLAGRLPIWRAAAAIWRDNFWLGVGPGRYSIAMLDGGYAARYLPDGTGVGVTQAHNMLLQAGAETGTLGLTCLAAWWMVMLAACWRAWNRQHIPLVAFGLLFALGGFLMRSMSDNFLDGLVTTDRTRVLIWTLLAATLALGRLPQPAGVTGDTRI